MEEPAVQQNVKCWRRRQRLIIIISVSIILAILFFGFLGNIIYFNLRPVETCQTAGCIKTANLILSRMDQTIHPCDDFYNYACGNFIKKTKIPNNKFSVNSFSTVSEKVVQQLKNVLEEPTNSSEPKYFGLAKKYYKICINESKIDADNLGTIKNIINKVGGWPIVEGDNWNEDDFDWKELVYKLNKLGFDTSYFLKISIETDSKNNSKQVVEISQPEYGYTRDVMLVNSNDVLYIHYFNYIVESAVYFGANRTVAKEDAMELLEFYRELASISLSREELREAMKEYNPQTIEEMEQNYTFIPWLEYLNNIFYPTVQLTKKEVIINQTPKYIERLQNVLLMANKKSMANYIIWVLIKDVMSTLPKDIRQIRLKFESAVIGISEDKTRWSDCVTKTERYFGLVTGALYIRKYFNQESKQRALELVNNIKTTFIIDILEKNEWMDETTKRTAIQKAEKMSVHIGYPDQLLDDKVLENFYHKLKITDNLLETNLLICLFLREITISQLYKPFNETKWILLGGVTASVNAFYMFNRNVIGFPAGILQDIFFSKDRPNYVNYGSIGYIIGHEITHGFDDQGREFDYVGNLVNWWTPESENEFYRKSYAIINQYNTFVIPELYNVTVNGAITTGENIADNGGVKTAYHAYISHQKEKELPLPGLTSFSPRQMFWLSAANLWCSLERPDYLYIALTTDPHSPTRFRVNGPLINSDEFSEDFNCPVGTNMNPKVKCQLW